MENLQSNSSSMLSTSPQSQSQSSQVSNAGDIQGVATTQADLSKVATVQIKPGCIQNCVAGVSTQQANNTGWHVKSADMLGGGLLLFGAVIVTLFARKVLTS